jgi:hypothetical protein
MHDFFDLIDFKGFLELKKYITQSILPWGWRGRAG